MRGVSTKGPLTLSNYFIIKFNIDDEVDLVGLYM